MLNLNDGFEEKAASHPTAGDLAADTPGAQIAVHTGLERAELVFPALLVPQFPLGTLSPQQPWSLGVSLQGTVPLLSQLLRVRRAGAGLGVRSLSPGNGVCVCWGGGDSGRVLVLALDMLLACAESGVTLSGLANPVVISANCNYLLPAV